MTDLIVYGASDDLVETEGLVREEYNPPYGKPALMTVKVDDAIYTRLIIDFDPDDSGCWRIQPTTPGVLVRLVPARETDDGTYDEDGCPGYSDKAYIDMGSIEARQVNVSVEEA